MSQTRGTAWVNMNENLMALLEAVLTLAASDISLPRHPPRQVIKPGGYSEEIFLGLTEDEKEELGCTICYQILKDTRQCVNNHKFCSSCIYVWSTTGQYANRLFCPVCRCRGHYFRNEDMDEQISKKKVRCSLKACKWTGLLKYMVVHKHTNFDGSSQTASCPFVDDSSSDLAEDSGDHSNVLELPYLGRAPPRLPHRSQSRYTGTGLLVRNMMTTTETDEDSRNPTVLNNITALDRGMTSAVGASNGIPSRNTNAEISFGNVPGHSSVRQRVYPVRRATLNRIHVNHTDSNNNLATPSLANSNMAELEGLSRSSLLSSENSGTTSRQPRPPSAPRPPNQTLRRNLPELSGGRTPRGNIGNQRSSPSTTSVIRSPPTFSAAPVSQASGASALNSFHDRLQESRDRLQGLMSTFSGELERSRQGMADFQEERERLRQVQLSEVRELGRRLTEVASELRVLLNHRHFRRSESDE